MRVIFLGGLIAAVLLSCQIVPDDLGTIDDPWNAYRWVTEKFTYEVVGYRTIEQTVRDKTGDCYTLTMVFCAVLRDHEPEPEIVIGKVAPGLYHAIAKIGGVYYDCAAEVITRDNPFQGVSVSMPWRMADGYKFYARYIEK